MFSEKSESLVTELINAEYHNARKNYGETYCDHDEASAVLLEECMEVRSEYIMLKTSCTEWNKEGYVDRALDIYRYARNVIKEMSQVAAVALKIIDSTNPDRNPHGEENGNNGRNKI